MPFLANPKKKRRRASRARASGTKRRKRSPPKGYTSWKTYMTSIRPGGKKRRSSGKRKRRRTVHSNAGGRMAKRRSRGKRRFRRNPGGGSGFSVRGIGTRLFDAVKGAGYVTVGKAAARILPQMVGLPKTGVVGLIVQGLSGVVAGELARRTLGGDAARLILIGALTAPIEAVIAGAGIPLLSPALSAYPLSAYAPAGMDALPSGELGDMFDEVPY